MLGYLSFSVGINLCVGKCFIDPSWILQPKFGMKLINLKIKLDEKLFTLLHSSNVKLVLLFTDESNYCLEPLEVGQYIILNIFLNFLYMLFKNYSSFQMTINRAKIVSKNR